MSIRLMSIVWDIPWPSQSALLIALKLADYANDEGGSIHPRRDTLAKHAQTSLATVKRTLAAFRDVGLLTVVEEGGMGRGHSTKYEMNIGLLMRLHDGYAELQRDENDPHKFVICARSAVDIDDEKAAQKAAHSEPLNSLGAHQERLAAQSTGVSGSIDEPRTTNLDPPITTTSRASGRAREDFKFGLGKSGSARVAIPLKSTDLSWGKWIAHLRLKGENALADAAEVAGTMTVVKRWPEHDTPLPTVDKRPKFAQQLAERVVGEGA